MRGPARISTSNANLRCSPEYVSLWHNGESTGGFPTIQGKGPETLVFIRTDPRQFVRRSINLGDESGDRIFVLGRPREHNDVVFQETLTLKALCNLKRQWRTYA